MKRPAFMFYPADWRKDAALQSCSITARGVWHELLCVMHECKPYGNLTLNGQPMDAAKIARLIGATLPEYLSAMKELQAAGVYSTQEDGTIYSRRMVKDEAFRKMRSMCGALGGNPKLRAHLEPELNLDHNLAGKLEPTPSFAFAASAKTKAGKGFPALPRDDAALCQFGQEIGKAARPGESMEQYRTRLRKAVAGE